ncbi:motile sperm domain-containing protein 1-like [Lycorma delicatula]|uniref:motile sperm domain-containing protein 1-like n=1 Tax=Lycorma delicatula TaxID=130591 RepID=UPI003F519B66
MQSGSPFDGKVPVFVFPYSINFYLEDKATHKQILTVYNPYECAVLFKVLCTAPKKYTVVDPEGSIKPQSCIDIVVRHNVVSPSNCNVTDKFRIQMRDCITKQMIGKRDVTATLLSGDKERSTPEHESFQQLPSVPSIGRTPPSQYSIKAPTAQYAVSYKPSDGVQAVNNNPNYIVIFVAVVCIVALLLPTEGDFNSATSIFISVHLKLVFSFVLGLVTMVILRPY